jgi:hypothetical protein
MILSENRLPLFRIMLWWSMIFSENRLPLFRIMLWGVPLAGRSSALSVK